MLPAKGCASYFEDDSFAPVHKTKQRINSRCFMVPFKFSISLNLRVLDLILSEQRGKNVPPSWPNCKRSYPAASRHVRWSFNHNKTSSLNSYLAMDLFSTVYNNKSQMFMNSDIRLCCYRFEHYLAFNLKMAVSDESSATQVSEVTIIMHKLPIGQMPSLRPERFKLQKPWQPWLVYITDKKKSAKNSL